MVIRKAVLTLAAATLVIGTQLCSPPVSRAFTQISASIDFYDALSPYGSWVSVSRYGDCWVPLDTPVGWRPYTVGYWVDTDYGWMWIAQDPWGGLPYHYGRWVFHSYYGWVWVPDEYEMWAPAWVSWRYSDDYIGWAPLPPEADWRSGYGLTLNVSVIDRQINRSGWCFAPVRSFGSTRIRSALLPPSRNVTLLARTRNVTRYESYNSLPAERGLRPEMIERATGRRFERYRVVDSRSTNFKNVAIQGRTIEVYRPRIAGVRSRRAKFVTTTQPGRGVARQRAEQRQFDQRMGRERQALEREHQREIRANRERVEANQLRQRQREEMRAQRERETQERRSLEGRRRAAEEMQRNEGRGRGQGGDQNRGRGQGQGQAPDRERGQARERQDQGRGRDRDQSQDKSSGRDQGQSQNDQDKDKDKDQGRGRGHGRGGN
jgi:hypothetical protein